MAKTKKRVVLTTEEKLHKAVQALFVLHARQVDMGNKEMREILGGDQADIDAVAKVVNKALKKAQKQRKH
jgi:hypothetical protein